MDGKFDKIRYSVAIILSILTLIIWFIFFQETIEPENYYNKIGQSEENKLSSNEIKAEKSSNNSTRFQDKVKIILEDKEEKSLPKEIILKSSNLEVTISSKNAVVSKAIVFSQEFKRGEKKLKSYGNFEAQTDDFFQTGRMIFASSLQNIDKSNHIFFNIEEPIESLEKEVTFFKRIDLNGENIILKKRYSIKNYELYLSIWFETESGSKISNQKIGYFLVNGSNIGNWNEKESSVFDVKNIAYDSNGELTKVLSPGIFSMFSTPKTYEETSLKNNWISLDNRFYIRILKPSKEVEIEKTTFLKIPSLDNKTQKDHLIGAYYSYLQAESQDYTFYYLPKERSLLNYYYDVKDEFFFNLFHQFSFMRILSSIMYWIIQQIFMFVGNYGWSILIMTILIKIITFPLTYKSTKSMQKMQILAPRIENLKKQYANNPKKFNSEVMLLYKKEKASPLSGCLPMFIPLPIFIALYSLFQNMAELEGMSFYWIQDLSRPDVIFELPWALPLIGSSMHLLPIIMTITTFIQSYLTPQPAKKEANNSKSSDNSGPNQQQIMSAYMKYFMPLLFFVISWNMPSALVFFWTIQNIFTIIQTAMAKKGNNREKTLITSK